MSKIVSVDDKMKQALDDAVALISTLEGPYLKQLTGILNREIEARDKNRIQEVRLQIQRLAADVGMSIEDLMTLPKARAARAPLGMRFQHPTEPDKQWSGMGRRPEWVRAWIDSGHSLAEASIPT